MNNNDTQLILPIDGLHDKMAEDERLMNALRNTLQLAQDRVHDIYDRVSPTGWICADEIIAREAIDYIKTKLNVR